MKKAKPDLAYYPKVTIVLQSGYNSEIPS